MPDQKPAYTTFNAQYPNGRGSDTLADAKSWTTGWRTAWVEDASGSVVHGVRPEGGFSRAVARHA